MVSLLLVQGLLSSTLQQLAPYLDNFFLAGGREMTLTLSVLLYKKILKSGSSQHGGDRRSQPLRPMLFWIL